MSCNNILVLVAAAAALQGEQAERAEIRGAVLDTSGASISGAEVVLRLKNTGASRFTATSPEGKFRFPDTPGGFYVLAASTRGLAPVSREIRLTAGDVAEIEIRLQPASLSQEIRVTASSIIGLPENLERLPGSVDVITSSMLTEGRIFTAEEALRKVAGVHARGEEGFGLRPNIGIRGLNPTRSSRVLLLEDGVPLSYAPYGDNASYYHPPVDRFDSVEVVKGAGQILYGPMTVGGVINYITPAAPEKPAGSLSLTGGNRDYVNAHLRYGGTLRGAGLLLDAMRKQGEGARENLRHGLNDFNLKSLTPLGARQALALRFNYYGEDSNVTYSGLREDEFRANPRGNPFANDFFNADRWGASAGHTWAPRREMTLSTNLYGAVFRRDWWRQSSNSRQRPNDSADPLCGGMANLHSTCGNEGRLRDYSVWGIEPKMRAGHRLGEADFGLRLHFENQERIQQNGQTPTARAGPTVENNRRQARAVSSFAQNQFRFGRWTVTPGLRYERVHYRRLNRLLSVSGENSLTNLIPGLGVAFNPSDRFTFFAGAHRGFAPPRVEDVINNSTGASIELDPELSWNYEAGARARLSRSLRLEATLFRMDFSNQIVPSSVAGGLGAALTNAGETLHQGAELSGRWDWRSALGTRHSFHLRGAWTWLPEARYEGQRYSTIPGFSRVLVTRNRLPYAPEHLLNASLGYSHTSGLNAMLESVLTGRQFGDDLNTRNGTPDGQQGILPGNAIWNATVNYPVEPLRASLFFAVKNLLNRTVIVDRSRGLLPGIPRLAQVGLQFSF